MTQPVDPTKTLTKSVTIACAPSTSSRYSFSRENGKTTALVILLDSNGIPIQSFPLDVSLAVSPAAAATLNGILDQLHEAAAGQAGFA